MDAHLRAVADRLEALERESRSGSMASAASEQVQAIVAAAESSAAEIRRAAEHRAHEAEQQTASETERLRAEAATRAGAYVETVREATARMLERLEAIESELGTLVGELRSGGERLDAGLARLAESLSELTAAGPGPAREEAGDEPDLAAPEAPSAEVETLAAEPRAPGAEPAAGEEADGSEEKARLIALEMALSGKPREETDEYLARNFGLADRNGLVDEIYSNVGEIGR